MLDFISSYFIGEKLGMKFNCMFNLKVFFSIHWILSNLLIVF